MNLILILILPYLLGWSLASRAIADSSLPGKQLLLLSLAGPVGFGASSLILFWSYIFWPEGAKVASPIIIAAAIFALFIGNSQRGKTRPIWALPKWPLLKSPEQWLTFLAGAVFLYLLYHYLAYAIRQMNWNGFGGWDARYFWHLKARFYFRDPSEWRGMFDPVLNWSHPDYPLLLPGAIAWGWNIMGKEILSWPMIVDLMFMLSLCFFVLWYLGSFASRAGAFLAAGFMTLIYMFRFWSTTHYADIPLCFFFTTATITLMLALRLNQNGLFLLSGILTGLSIWTKNEGLFFLMWAGLLLTILAVSKKAWPEQKKGPFLLCFLAGVCVPLLTVVFLKTVFGKTGGEYLGSDRNLFDYLRLLFGSFERTRFITVVFGYFFVEFQRWSGLWLLFFASILLGKKSRFSDFRWVPLAMTWLILVGYYTVIHVTPYDLRLQIETALLRIMSHAAGLAIIFTFDAFTLRSPLPQESVSKADIST